MAKRNMATEYHRGDELFPGIKYWTDDPTIFRPDPKNRQTKVSHNVPLSISLDRYGMDSAQNLVCTEIRRTKNSLDSDPWLEIKDGNNRFLLCTEKGKRIYFSLTDLPDTAYVMALRNLCVHIWQNDQYGNVHEHDAKNPIYAKVRSIAEDGRVSQIVVSKLVAGWPKGGITMDYKLGDLQGAEEVMALRVIALVKELTPHFRYARETNCIRALYGFCHVKHFDERHLIYKVAKWSGIIRQVRTPAQYAAQFQYIYNYHSKNGGRTVELCIAAENALAEKSGSES